MIRLITKETFYNILGDCKEFIKFDNISKEDFEHINTNTEYYILEEYGIFVYSSRFNLIYVPKNNKKEITPDIIKQTEFAHDEWSLEKVSDKINNPLYTLNAIRRFNICGEAENRNWLTTGDWIIKNSITKEEIPFSVKVVCDWGDWYTVYYVFPEKLDVPAYEKICKIKGSFINQIVLWEKMKRL